MHKTHGFEDLSQLAARTVKVGDVYEITMNEANVTKPEFCDIYSDEYLIVIGVDSKDVAYGRLMENFEKGKLIMCRK